MNKLVEATPEVFTGTKQMPEVQTSETTVTVKFTIPQDIENFRRVGIVGSVLTSSLCTLAGEMTFAGALFFETVLLISMPTIAQKGAENADKIMGLADRVRSVTDKLNRNK